MVLSEGKIDLQNQQTMFPASFTRNFQLWVGSQQNTL